MKIININSDTHKATALVTTIGGLMTFLPTVREFIPDEYFGPAIVWLGIAFHLLRNKTTTSIDQR